MKKLITIMTLFLIAFQIYAGEIVETDNVTYTNCSVSIVGTGQLNVGTGVVNQARIAAWSAAVLGVNTNTDAIATQGTNIAANSATGAAHTASIADVQSYTNNTIRRYSSNMLYQASYTGSWAGLSIALGEEVAYDSIVLPPGEIVVPGSHSYLTMADGVRLIGAGPNSTIIRAEWNDADTLQLGDGCSVQGIGFTNGYWSYLDVVGTGPLYVNDCRFQRSESASRGAIELSGGIAVVRGCVFEGGAAYAKEIGGTGSAIVSHSVVDTNRFVAGITVTWQETLSGYTAAQLLADPIQYTLYQLTSASTVTVSEAWTTNRFYLDLTNNVELAVSGVDTNKAAGWMLDVRLNSYSLSFGASITNLTNSDNFTRTNSYQSIVGNRPIFEAVTEVW